MLGKQMVRGYWRWGISGHSPQFLLPTPRGKGLVYVDKVSSLRRGLLKDTTRLLNSHAPVVNQSLGFNCDSSPKKSPENPDTKKPQFPPGRDMLLFWSFSSAFRGQSLLVLRVVDERLLSSAAEESSEIITYGWKLLWFDPMSSPVTLVGKNV